jgi:hypothetical protein
MSNPKDRVQEIMEKLRVVPHSEPLTDTWTNDFFSREGEDREVVGDRLRDKTVPCQVQRRRMTNSFPCGTHLHRMSLRRRNEYTLRQRALKQREDDRHEGCGHTEMMCVFSSYTTPLPVEVFFSIFLSVRTCLSCRDKSSPLGCVSLVERTSPLLPIFLIHSNAHTHMSMFLMWSSLSLRQTTTDRHIF